MAHRARLCPYCRAMNGRDAGECVRCGRKLPGPAMTMVLDLASTLGATGAPVTVLLLLVNIAVFAAMHTGGHAKSILGGASVLRLVQYGAIFTPFTDDEWWRVLSADFVHIGLIHIGMNMFALVQLGRESEPLVGSGRYALTYVLTGMAGFWTSIEWAHLQHLALPTAGASASLFGILGMLLGWLIGRRDPNWKQFAIRAVIYSLLFGFFLRANNAAHVGGLIAGIVFGFAWANERRPYQRSGLANVLGGLAMLGAVASIALARLSPISKDFSLREKEREELEQGFD
jgi:rhomboid protease GluP